MSSRPIVGAPRADWLPENEAMTPSWAPGLPLGADCKLGETYG